jgi:fructoselysine-6-phosphate deglycase
MATDLLNFDPTRYLRIQSGAVGLAEQIDAVVADALGSGVTNVVFAGAGGAGILMQPAAALLRDRSTFRADVVLPAELVVAGSATVGRDTLVVIPSLSGTTAESLEALDHVKAAGARVLVLTGHADSPLATKADVSLVNFAEDDTSCESFYLQSLLLALSTMARTGALEDHAAVVAELARLPELLLDAKAAFEEPAHVLAEAIAADPWHIVTGSGNTWPEAFYYGMCILEEMQWIRTRPVHASDFFHGTLELVEADVSVLLLKGEDATRPLAERVERFVSALTDKLLVLDAAEVELPGISQSTRALVSPVVLAALLERVSAHLEVLRDHPLTTRRYYRRMAY